MLLKKLTEALGVSGNEGEVRELIKGELDDSVDQLRVDRMGNLFATKNTVNSDYRIIVTAHMDEIGLMVKGIEESGLLRFAPIGGIDPRILVSKIVLIGDNKLIGIIGAKAIHMQKPSERKKALSIDDLYIDIGVSSKEEAEKLLSIGDYIAFQSDYVEFANNRVKSKALDNRVGCAILIELLKMDLNVNITGIFTVQEEIGLRGSAVAANQIKGDLAIVLEGTTCSDVKGIEPHFQATNLDGGPAISIMDRTSIYNRPLVDSLIETAKENNIPWQYRRSSFGGNDAGSFHLAQEGTPCVSLAVPCRYIHSPASVLSLDDYRHTLNLTVKFIEKISKGGVI
ncbi:Cellulase [Alkaliphilus metalliredigens QYMF]|uniref:Cellulase n=1 Tax=Alkaliphilus metalliredigens (strain QYMF) TaxID=293826 RepID=A6TRF5_ALKMQ|nr:M42 family metallopeptidase [Alkaliphilus metalliredigens]ABR48773.1 Cellulase [Alkaliphilus metalliredigens QYMF]